MQRTVKVKINVHEGFLAFMETCSLIFNEHIEWCFSNKSYNKVKAHQDLYFSLREKYPKIPSALLQTIRDTALESVKQTKFKFKPFKKLHSAIRYDKRTVYFKKNLLKLSWSGDRIKQNITLPSWFSNKYPNFVFQSATVSYNKNQKQFYANLTYESNSPQPILSSQNDKIVGVDRGLFNIISLSNGINFSSKNIRKQKRKFMFVKRQLQAKVSPSAKRKLRKRSGKEKRFSLNINHIISKWLVSQPFDVFVFEDLKGIRKQNKGKTINNWLGNWTFYQLEQLVKYKAEALGKIITKVDARYTSQKCSECGNVDKKSRNKDKYCCVKCQHEEHADINAAKNIKQNYLTSLLELSSESDKKQAVVNRPNGEGEICEDFEFINVSTEECSKGSLYQMLDTSSRL